MTEPVAYVYEDGERVAKLTNKAIIPEFEQSDVWEVERV